MIHSLTCGECDYHPADFAIASTRDREEAVMILAAAASVIAAQALTPVYDWLASVVGFPFDFTFGDKPPWLDVQALAEAWWRYDGRRCQQADDPETYRLTILAETGWDE